MLSQMSGIQKIIKPIPDYNMIPICYRKGRAVPRQRNLDEFLGCGKKDTGSLMPKKLLLNLRGLLQKNSVTFPENSPYLSQDKLLSS